MPIAAKPWDLGRVALSELGARPLRSCLAILGIAAGVATAIVTLAIGAGAREAVDRDVRSLGANLLVVNAASGRQAGARLGAGTAPPLTEADLDAIRTEIDGVRAATAFVNTREQVVAGGVNWNPYVQGVDHDWFAVMEWPLDRGRSFTEEEVRRGLNVVVLGSTVARELFGDEDPLGRWVRIRATLFRVIGVAVAKGGDRDDVVFVPLEAARRRVLGFQMARGAVMAVFVKFGRDEDVGPGIEQMSALLRQLRRLGDDQPDDFTIRNLTEIARARGETTRTTALLVALLSLASLLVGGINIMNLMIVSVTERTREIGLRLAVGARPSDIGMQLLIEAATLSLVGGVIGVVLGAASAQVLAVVAGWPLWLNVQIVGGAVIASALVGILAGTAPASQAARLDPITSLRR